MKTNPAFNIIPPPTDSFDDGEVIDFATIGKTHIQQWRPGPDYQTQLLIEDDTNGDYDVIPLDITHFPDFNRFNFRVEAMSKAECLRKLRKIMQVVKALPAVGIPQPMREPPAKPLALMEGRAA
jgi:hypothetical protein